MIDTVLATRPSEASIEASPCDDPTECGNAATHALTCSACAFRWLRCDPCIDPVRETLEKYASWGNQFLQCTICGKPSRPTVSKLEEA